MKNTITLLASFLLVLSAMAQSKTVTEKISKTEYKKYEVLKSDKSVKDGLFQHYKNNRVVEEGFFKNNVKDSLWVTISFGDTSSVGTYKNGLQDGEWTYFKTTHYKIVGHYAKGKRDGQFSYYGWDRKKEVMFLIAKGRFENDQRTGLWEFRNPTNGDNYQTFNFDSDELKYVGEAGGDTLGHIKTGRFDGMVHFADSTAQFKTGINDLYKYLGKNTRYPAEARDKNIQGRVYVSFIIRSDGSLEDVKILRGQKGLNEEAVRVIKSTSGMWKPALFEGGPVSSKYILPIVFSLR